MTVMVLLVVATVVACGLGVVVWMQRREAQQRSAARVAALAVAIDGPADSMLDTFTAEGSGFGSWQAAAATPSRRAWIVAVGAVPVALAIAALLVTRGPRHASPVPQARQPESLELLDMRHARAGDMLMVTGTVRVRGRDAAPVTAIVTGRDDEGRVVASAHAPLDDAALDVGGESSFQVSVTGGHAVRRYQVRFETPLGPVVHIDRRTGRRAAATP
jgi:hypothetical protein